MYTAAVQSIPPRQPPNIRAGTVSWLACFLWELAECLRLYRGGKKMSFHFIKLLPTPDEIREQFPVPAKLVRIKEERDKEIRDVITGKSNKFLVIT